MLYSYKVLSRATLIGLAVMAATPASAIPIVDVVNVMTVGSNPAGNALDPLGNNIGGIPLISWTHTVGSLGAGPAWLSIVAEGIDTNEDDEVFINGTSLGFLTNQGFQVPDFNLQPAAGALPNITALTISAFDVSALLQVGINTIEVHVDPTNWVNQVETSTLSYNNRQVPEPGTLALLLAGLGGLSLLRRRA